MAAAKTLVFEIGTEEMPASAVDTGIDQLKAHAESALVDARLSYGKVDVMGTPRRLALVVTGLADRQSDAYEAVKGPAERIAYDEKGKPTAAAAGFARSQKVEVKDLVVEETAQGRYVFARSALATAETVKVLPKLLRHLVLSLNFPKSMRWNHGDIRFSRPIRWMLALYGAEPIHVPVADIPSGDVTYGHRALSNKPLKVRRADEYVTVLSGAGVMVDQRKREATIRWEIDQATGGGGSEARAAVNEAVLKEVVHLVENPQAVLGSFAAEFLKVPRTVVVTAMESHQRYFPVESGRGKLLPFFVVIHNGNRKWSAMIRQGHERVLRARLSDARFFFEEDLKEPLTGRVEDLRDILFQEKLGTLFDKTRRLVELSREMGRQVKAKASKIADAERAAYLSKADLTTDMVREFPNLQGVIGGEYALVGKETKTVARAIREHYLPRYVGDALPATLPGALVSMADKLDTIVGCFAAGFTPTGSEDPYALRRQGQGVVAVILERRLPLALDKTLALAVKLYRKGGFKLRPEKDVRADLDVFFRQRLSFHFASEGFRYDVADAVLVGPLEDVPAIEASAREIDAALGTPMMEDLLTAFERCYNLSRGAKATAVKPALFRDKAERDLYQAISRVEKNITLRSLASLRPVVDRFFDEVLVMAPDKKLRQNRLALLLKCVNAFLSLADFSKIVREST